MEKGSIEFEHNKCFHEYDFGTIYKSLESIEQSLGKINGLPGKVTAHEDTINRMWKFIYAILFVIGGGVVTATATAILK